jgi:hypothetical protein
LTNEIQAGFASKYFTTRASASEMHKKEASDINDEANYRRKSRTRMWKKAAMNYECGVVVVVERDERK